MSESYSSVRLGLFGRTRELASLYRYKRRDIPRQVRKRLDRLELSAGQIAEDRGTPLDDGDVLVIGPGQHRAELQFWAAEGNRVTGIDLDPYEAKPSARDYWRMLRHDGAVRAVKSLGRRALRLDAAYERELHEQLGSPDTRKIQVLAMDAGATRFVDQSFDLVYSHAVLEHVRQPDAVIAEAARVLRPGGVANVGVHLYTSDSGCHDARIFAGRREGLPYWAHLRPAYEHLVQPNSYLNKWRLARWIRTFEQAWPGVRFDRQTTSDTDLIDALAKLRSVGELEDYTDDELLTVELIARWRRDE